MIRLRSLAAAGLFAAATTAAAADGGTLTLRQALDRIEETSVVKSAQTAVAAASATVRRLDYAGDVSLSAGPQAKATTEFAMPFPEQTEINATVAAKVPVGLSDSAKLQVTQARSLLDTAKERLAAARDVAYESVYASYVAAWLTQEEQRVIGSELAAARAYAAALEEQFRAGKVSLVDLKTADEDLQEKETAASKGALARRLSWLRLSTALALPYTAETPELEPDPAIESPLDLPPPPELVAWALARDADLRSLERELTGVDGQLALLARPDLSSAVQLSGGIAEHVFSLSYTFDQPLLGASYTIPFYTHGSIPGNNSQNLQNTWNVGVSVSVALGAGKGRELETESLRIAREQSSGRFDDRRSALQLDIRARYQQWLTSRDEIAQAKTAVTRAETNRAIVDSRRKLGLASDFEVLQATASLERARFAVLEAQTTARVAFLAAANSAGYLREVIDRFEKGGTE